MKSADGIELEEFLALIKSQSENLDLILSEEPELHKAILLLAMTEVFDCMDCEEPEKALESSKQVISNVANFAHTVEELWLPQVSGELEFSEKEVDQNEWDSLFQKAQDLLEEIITEHLDAYGREKQEDIELAYIETTTSLTYMMAVACARTNDIERSVDYINRNLDKTFDVIRNSSSFIKME